MIENQDIIQALESNGWEHSDKRGAILGLESWFVVLSDKTWIIEESRVEDNWWVTEWNIAFHTDYCRGDRDVLDIINSVSKEQDS